ncbi:MAG TPA: Tm-1-like ATP-binding domain-containing protein, partial [Anaerolineae bacterium]|nr:Tm-1-like ATP-binding domain-containing protein [Anaerolineae bacterium]
MAILLIGTLDTKGPEIAYVRDRIRALGAEALVLDSGILGEPVDIVPDITRSDVALAAGSTIDALRNAGTRGAAVEKMKEGVKHVTLDLFAQGKLQGVLCLGGAEGAVLGATAMRALPIGVPKILVTPLASGKRTFGTFMGTRDIFVLHSVIDIAGLNPISQTVFDNAAAAAVGMAQAGYHPIDSAADDGKRYVALTMLGN